MNLHFYTSISNPTIYKFNMLSVIVHLTDSSYIISVKQPNLLLYFNICYILCTILIFIMVIKFVTQ